MIRIVEKERFNEGADTGILDRIYTLLKKYARNRNYKIEKDSSNSGYIFGRTVFSVNAEQCLVSAIYLISDSKPKLVFTMERWGANIVRMLVGKQFTIYLKDIIREEEKGGSYYFWTNKDSYRIDPL